MAKLRLTIELNVDDNVYCAFSDDDSERDWFYNHLLGDELILHSNLVGAAIGTVKVMKVHQQKYGCHCELETGQTPGGCVIDASARHDCVHASRGIKKEDCEYWKIYFAR